MARHARIPVTAVVVGFVACCTMILPPATAGIVAIKTGPERIGASQLAALLRSLGCDPLIVSEPGALVALLQDPDLECVVVDGWWRHEFEELGQALLGYFEGGGSLVGFYNSGHNSAGILSTQVFPANGTLRSALSGATLECTVVEPDHEICQDLPTEFAIKDRELVFHGQKVGRQYVYTPCDLPLGCRVLIVDKTFGAPVLMANEQIGRSVYFAGGGITTTTATYLDDAQFQALLGAALRWAREGAGADARRERLGERLQEGKSRLASVDHRIEEIRRRRSTSGLEARLILIGLAGAGLVSGAYLLAKG